MWASSEFDVDMVSWSRDFEVDICERDFDDGGRLVEDQISAYSAAPVEFEGHHT